MAEYKGTITLIVAALVLFGIFVAFGTGIIQPLLDNIGNQLNGMVDSAFGDATGAQGNFDDLNNNSGQ